VRDGSREFMKSIAAVPTEDQRKKLLVIVGPPFKFIKG